jgi:hypothetical protein
VLVLRCGSAGVVWCPYAGWSTQCLSLHKDTTPPQPNHTVTPTHIEPEQSNTWNKSTISRKLLKMDVLTFETCWAVNGEIINKWHQVGLSLFNNQEDARSSRLKNPISFIKNFAWWKYFYKVQTFLTNATSSS